MTKKDYQIIAKALSEALSNTTERVPLLISSGAIVRDVAYTFAAHLAGDNPRFNREKFLSACGIEKGE